MESKCLNVECTLTGKNQEESKIAYRPATQLVCNYYYVPFNPDQRVCVDCFQECISYYDKLKCLLKNDRNSVGVKRKHAMLSSDKNDTVDNVMSASKASPQENKPANDQSNRFKEKTFDEDKENLIVKRLPKLCILRKGDRVYALKYSLLQQWYEAVVFKVSNDERFGIKYCDNGKVAYLNAKHIAYINQNFEDHELGHRVIARFQFQNSQVTGKLFAGIIAEVPNQSNDFRYMVFFDNGSAQYVYHENIRQVYHQSMPIHYDVHEKSKHLVSHYFNMYPMTMALKCSINSSVLAKLNNEWYIAKVLKLDSSLVQLKFLGLDYEHIEWLYIGSLRLKSLEQVCNKHNLHPKPKCSRKINDCVNENIKSNTGENYEINELPKEQPTAQFVHGVVQYFNLPTNNPIPLSFRPHQCSHFCTSSTRYHPSTTVTINTLNIPYQFGFVRHTFQNESSKLSVIYNTPCGFIIKNITEMYNYLKVTKSELTIDLFDFDPQVNPLAEYTVNPHFYSFIFDISFGVESKPISLVNHFNNQVPLEMEYINRNNIMPGVNLDLDTQFLCSCDCTDNCEDKTKCSCWQLTYEAQKNFPQLYDNSEIGYEYKRLKEPICTGIYECNAMCKCSKKTCLNRVVQNPMSSKLQVFLTEKKGWGVRTLTDIPQGSFICTYVGKLATEQDAEKNAMKHGDEYLAELNYIETVENIKEGYEREAFSEEIIKDNINSSEEEFNPKVAINKKISPKNYSRSHMSLRKKNEGKKNIKSRWSKYNTDEFVVDEFIIDGLADEEIKKPLRHYYDKDYNTYIVDSKTSGNVGRFLNHSCDPNVFVQNVFVDTHDLRFPWVTFFALTSIKAGTELTWDYNYSVGSVENKIIQCLCESKICRGRLL